MLCEARQRVSWRGRVLYTTQHLWEPGILLTTGPSTGGKTGRAGRSRGNCAVVWAGLRGTRPTRCQPTRIRQTAAAAADWRVALQTVLAQPHVQPSDSPTVPKGRGLQGDASSGLMAPQGGFT